MDDSWGQSIGVSAAGNFLTILLGLIVYLVRQKCKHCRSDCHTTCCDVVVSDQTLHEAVIELSHSSPRPSRPTSPVPLSPSQVTAENIRVSQV